MGGKVHCNNLCVATCGGAAIMMLWMRTLTVNPFHVCSACICDQWQLYLCVRVAVGVNDWNKKQEALEKKNRRYLRVMLELCKILAHYLINSKLNGGHEFFCLLFHSIKSALVLNVLHSFVYAL